LQLLNPLELHLEEIALKLLIDMVVLELAVHPNVTVETPVPILVNRLVQGCVGHRGSFKEFQEPVGCGHNHVIIIAIVVGCCIDLLDPRDLVGPMLFRESRDATVWELLDPVSGLPHPILNWNGKAWAAAVTVEYISLGALFGREGGMIVNKTCPEELEFFFLSVVLPGPLLVVFLVFMLTLFEGSDEATGDIGDCVKIVGDLDSGCGCTR
jgi:hypothetical protein